MQGRDPSELTNEVVSFLDVRSHGTSKANGRIVLVLVVPWMNLLRQQTGYKTYKCTL